MNWDDLHIFLVAVRAGSYTAAAQRLGVNRTTVGRRVDALEHALGVALFRDTPHGPEPTLAGLRVLEAAAAMDGTVDTMRRAIEPAHAEPDLIRIAGSGGILDEFLPEILHFRSDHQSVALELLEEPDPVAAVTHRRADLGLAIMRRPPRYLAAVPAGVLAQARYVRRGMETLPPLGWGHELETALPGQWITANLTATDSDTCAPTAFNSWRQMKQAVLQGFGTAKLWCFAADPCPDLMQIEPPDPRDDYPLWLLYRAKAPPGAALAQCVEALRAAIMARLVPTDVAVVAQPDEGPANPSSKV